MTYPTNNFTNGAGTMTMTAVSPPRVQPNGDLTYSEQAAGYFPVTHATVKCPLAGYERLEITYIVSRSAAEIERAEADAEGAGFSKQDALLAFVVAGFPTWPFTAIPCPTPQDPASFRVLPTHLYGWMLNTGYVDALKASVGKN